jgi:hypothetical protein
MPCAVVPTSSDKGGEPSGPETLRYPRFLILAGRSAAGLPLVAAAVLEPFEPAVLDPEALDDDFDELELVEPQPATATTAAVARQA